VQVHHDGREVALYSRNMEDVTGALPEVVEFVEATVDPPAILDGEVVAVDDAGDPLPFQEVLKRFRRKHGVERAREDVSVRLHAFDCLHAGGTDLLDAPLTDRHEELRGVVDDGDAVSALRLTDDPEEVAAVEAAAVEAGHEGVMLKDPDSPYSPGKRGRNWLKRKPDVETLDLVVTGAEWGEGRRAELLGTFECSVRVEGAAAEDGVAGVDGDYARVGNVATGLTDEDLADLTDLLEPRIRTREGGRVALDPSVVFEVGYEEIQRSPTYDAGYALRFPRFLGVREDLSPAEADSLDRLRRLADGAGGDGGGEEDGHGDGGDGGG
jgi:DNA ligase-1